MAKDFFKTLGVDFGRAGQISVLRMIVWVNYLWLATAQDLDTSIENTLEAFSHVVSQIHIKARFLEVPKGTVAGFINENAFRIFL